MADNLLYCKVVGTFRGFVADAEDEDDLPEFSIPTGSGVITPNVKMVRLGGTEPKIFYPSPVDVVLDAEGRLSQGGRPYVMLLSPTDMMNPNNFSYKIVMNLKFDQNKRSETWGPYNFIPTAGTTQDIFDMSLSEVASPLVVTRGKSLYESAVETGQFVGTEEEFVAQFMNGSGGGTGTTYVEDPDNPGYFIPA